MTRYLAITPAYNEEAFLPQLISCVASQQPLPQRWIIIDDGSNDATAAIIDEAARCYPWIEPQHLKRDRPRAPGGESIVMRFLPPEAWRDLDFIFRFDADLSFGPDLIDLLLREFERDPLLGIASATLYERHDERWREMRSPAFHTRGATKLYSTTCFKAIGGLAAEVGWDTVDGAKALMLGFRTRNFRHIRAFHHRPAGSASGLWRGRLQAGRAAFNSGYAPLYLLLRATRMLIEPPAVLGSVMLAYGFFEGYLRRRPMLADRELVKFVRRQQLRRLMLMESVWR